MKFTRQLEELQDPVWREHYIRYALLKQSLESGFSTPIASAAERSLSRNLSIPRSSSEAQHQVPADNAEAWRAAVERDAERVGAFVTHGLQGLRDRIDALTALSGAVFGSQEGQSAGSRKARVVEETQLLQALGRVTREAAQLRIFVELNHAALFKLLKKHDKRLEVSCGLKDLLPRLVGGETPLAIALGELAALEAQARCAALASSSCQGLCEGTSAGVLRLAAGFGQTSGERPGSNTEERVLCFFLGSSAALLLAIVLLISLPPTHSEEKPFSIVYFLTPFSSFRIGFFLALSLWGMGAVAQGCDAWGVNHMFLLGVDPRARVCHKFFYSRAAFLTTVWILVFGMYVVDYKWMIIKPVHSERGFNSRSSEHFVIYPALTLFLCVAVLLWPSKICRNKYKCALFRCLMRTVAAPFFVVSFGDNMAGDVLTSLAKPLQDIPPIICYLISSHPQTTMEVNHFIDHGDTCPHWVHHVVKPFIGGFPFWLRAWQCARRYRDTREPRHLLNLGKYMASLLVVVVSSTDWHESHWAVIGVSAVATTYAFTWDVVLDWGLSIKDLRGIEPSSPRSPVLSGGTMEETLVASHSTSVACDEPMRDERSFFATHRPAPKKVARVFDRKFYWLCASLDIVARLTWVQTLVPVTLVTNDVVQREIILIIVGSIEIARRCMWAAIRLEYEQVANAGGYRSLLWVPQRAVPGLASPPQSPRPRRSPQPTQDGNHTSGGESERFALDGCSQGLSLDDFGGQRLTSTNPQALCHNVSGSELMVGAAGALEPPARASGLKEGTRPLLASTDMTQAS